ncbi:hypothetical protein CAEBREN_11143 [Caenorhabditis brenneri]|uniref:CHK kinase-like domain-containing protein n=1 Tax=Caenorhabditis brenneri TaxID=135651 RepID=G0P0Q5_CAEBE|nr:hypothetical protein CAEBREN_11143 [Caenorhabditis brenneri]
MNLRQAQLRRLVENSFPEIQNFHEKVTVRYEKLENAKSFWSEIYLAHLKVNDGGEESVPETVFIKVPRISENVLRCEDEEAVDELQNVLVYYSKKENLFYKHFQYGTIPNFPFPKVYFTEDVKEEGTGGIVAENLSDKVYAVEHIPGLNHEQVLRLMEALAGFHSHLIQRKDKSYVESFVEGAHGRETYAPGMQKMMFEEALTLENVSPGIFGDKKRIQGIKWAFDYEKKNKATKQAISEIPGIICHADLNVTNMLWKKDSATHEIGAIIDYQMLFIGSIAFDIIRVLTLGLSREVRKEKTKSYLEYYHKTLSELFHGSDPFSLDQLNSQYYLIYPFASNFTLFGIAMYIKMYSDGTLGSPEFKEANCVELVDRANGIVKDIEALEKNFI